MERYEDIMHGALEGDLLRHAQPQVRDFMDAAKEIFNGKIMNDPQKTALEIGTYTLYRRLLDVFIPACCNSCGNVPMSYRETRALTLMGPTRRAWTTTCIPPACGWWILFQA